MRNDLYEKIRNHPLFPELVQRRRRLATTLTLLVLGTFFGFVLIMALQPGWLATPVASGSVTTVAIPIGIVMIGVYWLLTGYYIRSARRSLEQINQRLLKEVMQ